MTTSSSALHTGDMAGPSSPTGSNHSSDSEGRPVREKLQETRIDATASSDSAQTSGAPNGRAATAHERSRSGSDTDRGSRRRKRSFDDVGADGDEATSKKQAQTAHARKKSRDVTSPHPSDTASAESGGKSVVSRIEEHEGDATMTSSDQPSEPGEPLAQGVTTPQGNAPDKDGEKRISPHNKRTYDEAKDGDDQASKEPSDAGAGQSTPLAKDEPLSKRPREKSDVGGFGNTAAVSPFASLSSKAEPLASVEKAPENLPQTSEEKFKASGFGSFASSSASPFGAVGASASPSPFASKPAAGKLSSFASPAQPSNTVPAASGFGALGGTPVSSAFGGAATSTSGSVFGGSVSQSGFGGLGGLKGGISSFAKPGASTTITGLSNKPARPFGAAAEPEEEGSGDDEDGGDANEDGSDNEESHKTKQTEQTRRVNLAPQPVETGEEGEESVFVGRAKLFKLGDQGWKEAGVGPFRFNITTEEPRKARFILRADGTHRLLLNAAVTKLFKLGGPNGERSTDGKLMFAVPAADGVKLETHLLKMNAQRAIELYDEVQRVKEEL